MDVISPRVRQFIIGQIARQLTQMSPEQVEKANYFIDRVKLVGDTNEDVKRIAWLIEEIVKLFSRAAVSDGADREDTAALMHDHEMGILYGQAPAHVIRPALALDNILGYHDNRAVQLAFNPSAAYSYNYVALDSRYRDRANSSSTALSWSYSREIQKPAVGQIVSNFSITNIVAARLYQVAMPENFVGIDRAKLTGSISIVVQEFDTQVTAFSGALKYHFLGQYFFGEPWSDEIGRVITDDPQGMTFYFRQPIRYLDSITLSLGNPDQRIGFYDEYRRATVSYAPGQLIFTFAEPHNIISSISTMVVAGFTTGAPMAADDSVLIERVNAPPGIIVGWTSPTVLTFVTNVDPSDPIVGLEVNVYLVGLQLITFMEFVTVDLDGTVNS